MFELYQKAKEQIVPQTLYIVATPIGNLADITLRALAVLSCADIICAEDTRVTQQLLNAYGYTTRGKLVSVREQNEQAMCGKIIDVLSKGQIVAQVSDAGTPAICDPGARLVQAVRLAGFNTVPVAGASSVAAALSVAGIAQSEFYFAGFVPAKSGERHSLFMRFQESKHATVMFETPHRIHDTLAEMALLYPERQILLARELTKTFETILSDTVINVQNRLLADHHQSKGEMVLVLHGINHTVATQLDAEVERVMRVLSELPTKQAAILGEKITGVSKKILYEWLIQNR